MANRTFEVGGIWAKDAPNVPVGLPAPSVTYANSLLDEQTIERAWPFSDIVASNDHNEIMQRITLLLTELENQGILSYSGLTDYGIGSHVFGSDNISYTSRIINGPGPGFGGTVDPVGDTSGTWNRLGGFEPETHMLFLQASAPVGWSIAVTNNDRVLRIVSGAGGGGVGGTDSITLPPSTDHTHSRPTHKHSQPTHTHSQPTHFHAQVAHTHTAGTHVHGTSNHQLQISEMPIHSHTIISGGSLIIDGIPSPTWGQSGGDLYTISSAPLTNAGGDGSHGHGNTTGGSGSTGSGGNIDTSPGGNDTTGQSGGDNTGFGGGDNVSTNGPTAFEPKYVNVIECVKD